MPHVPPRTQPGRYDFQAIEARWQRYWEEHRTFEMPNPGAPGFDASKPKYYILDMFPYPSGAGLHVGHPVGYCATDIVARYKRKRGYNVLHPMGFDAFGLPAEQYAIEHNVPPAVTTYKNIERYRQQLRMFGFSYDWSREIVTCDPSYYKFTQWIFLRLFESWYDRRVNKARPIKELVDALEKGEVPPRVNPNAAEFAGGTGTAQKIRPAPQTWADCSPQDRRLIVDSYRLAYLADVQVNWCPALGTVLANEEVTNDGRSDRGNHPVFRRPLRQWMLRITEYADRLLSDLAELNWPGPIKLMQRNWIGKSTGANVLFPLADHWSVQKGQWLFNGELLGGEQPPCYEEFPCAIGVYTTRPDTLFGATYLVLAPEHQLVEEVTKNERRSEVRAYVAASANRSDLDRTADNKEKTGVFTGGYAINPVTGERIPIWIADYVLMSYGTGAIMAVPGSDSRDFDFACKYSLPIITVVQPTASWIEERLCTLAAGIDERAAAGFDDIAEQFPEWAAEIREHRRRSTALGEKTLQVLRNQVGIERLVEHYVRQPQSWGAAYAGEGIAVHSPGNEADLDVPAGVCTLNGLPTADAQACIIDWLEAARVGCRAVNFKLRDWIFSRQKYWGEPFPVLHGEQGETIALGEEELPVQLPEVSDFKPVTLSDDRSSPPQPPLGRAREWVFVERGGKRYRRDLNTMPQWAGSCWYYLRFIDPHNQDRFCKGDAERYWMPIDLYVGGAEHAVLHLLYSRFWHKVLYDLGWVSTAEPFGTLFNQGMIQSFAFRDGRGMVVGPDRVEETSDGRFVLRESGEPVERIVAKMSKALRNVVNPDEIIKDWGADTFRLYEMYMGPLEASKPWNTRDVPGLFKLCQRIWRLLVDVETNELCAALTETQPDEDTLRALHKLIKRVTADIEQLKFNTAIAALFDFVNFLTPRDRRPRAVIEPFVQVVSPFAPHLAEELWHRLGHDETLAYEPWPSYDERLIHEEEVEIAVQVNGKVKARVMVAADADEDLLRQVALGQRRVADTVQGKTVHKVVVVKGRLVNIVAR